MSIGGIIVKWAICDDHKEQMEITHKYIVKAIEKSSVVHGEITISTFEDPIQLFEAHSQMKFTAIFLDVEMPVSGYAIADRFKSIYPKPKIIFVTGHPSKVFDSFPYEPFRFIEKYKPHRFDEAVNSLLKVYNAENKLIQYIDGHQSSTMPLKNILYFEGGNNYTTIYALNGTYKTSERVSELAETHQSHGVCKIHKSYAVNLYHVKSINRERVLTFKNDKTLPVSRRLLTDVKERFNIYRAEH